MREDVLKIYNKRRNNFPDGEEGDLLYDDYLEEIEDMVMTLSSPNVPVEE